MRFGRVLAISIAFAVIMSGLAFLTIGSNPDPNTIEPLSKPGGEEPRGVLGVPRVVCVEDFGFWDCGPCAIYEPFLIQAIENYGYSQVAPIFYHKFPGHDDPIAAYSPLDNIFREMYYNSWAAPWTHLDGIYYPSTLDQSAIEGYFDDRLAIPANVALTTTGDIDGLTATVSVNIEAVAEISTTDLIVQFALWEDHINVTERFGGPAPNGEEEFRWAMWTMEPDAFGVPIWPTGANPGDSLDIQQTFTLEPEWDISELGVTVFVQGNNSRFIEQAAVEDFTDNLPFVDILTPDSYSPDRVLGGVIPIEWNATDFEDDDSTLDVNIDYSPDGGTSWLNVMSGVDNNNPPYLWDTLAEGIPDGVNYIIRVEATDSYPQTNGKVVAQPFSINNIIDDEWFFQVQVSANMDLDMKPVELTSNMLHTPIPVVGDHLVGTWETTKTFSTANINGDWTFDIYGYMGNNAWTGYLFAKVFGSSDPITPLAITGVDDEDVGTFTSVHKFTWTGSLTGNIPDGDSIIVEIWLQVTAGGPAIEQTTNPDFGAGSTGWTNSLWHAWNTGPYPHMGTWNSTDGNPDGWIELELPFLLAVGSFLGGYWEQPLTPSGAPTSASLSFDWICTDYKEYSPGSMNNVSFYVFIDPTPGEPTFGTEVWNQNVTATTSWASVGPIDVLGIVNSASTYYLKVGVWADGLTKDSWGIGGYDNVELIWETPTNTFTMIYDCGESQSSVRPNIGSSLPSTYDIEIPDPTGPWPAWRFVSFPINATGDMSTVFNDTLWGDGGTSWDHLQWYDTDDLADSWKSYAPFKPASLNDLLSVNNTMGLWIHITANGGDGNLTVGTGVLQSSTSITLYAGWNMVGYPSLTEKSVTDALAGTGFDMPVEGFNASAPYRLAPIAETYMMKPGEGYWVHVPADTTWVVDW